MLKRLIWGAVSTLFILALVACASDSTATPSPGQATLVNEFTPDAPAPTQPLPTTPAPTRGSATLYLAPELTTDLRAAIEPIAVAQKIKLAPNESAASLSISNRASQGAQLLTEQVYAVAAWFPTLRTSVTFADLQKLWKGQPTADGFDTLLVAASDAPALTALFGAPSNSVHVVKPGDIVPQLWKNPNALAILPFDQLTVKLTALPVDGQSVLDRDLDVSKYPLVARYYVNGDAAQAKPFFDALRPHIAATNRDTASMTSIVMTGVTAMGRYTAYTMDQKQDPAYPARKVANILSRADITHVSNEITFVDNCPTNLENDSIVLCSKPSYIATLKLLGTDIVGLTGNHMGDYGFDNFLKTLDIYDANGMKYYAGGRNTAEARRALIVQDHGNRIAFLGANSFGPQSYWATDTQPGTNGYDANVMKQEIEKAQARADLVFVEYQADEIYDYAPDAVNTTIFRGTIDDGADVVTGVMAHHPGTIEFSADGKRIILYGLGNFAFDQMFNDEVRQGLIPRHTLYKGHLLQTELLTTMLEDYAQPRWATPAEHEKILRGVFDASGFKSP